MTHYTFGEIVEMNSLGASIIQSDVIGRHLFTLYHAPWWIGHCYYVTIAELQAPSTFERWFRRKAQRAKELLYRSDGYIDRSEALAYYAYVRTHLDEVLMEAVL